MTKRVQHLDNHGLPGAHHWTHDTFSGGDALAARRKEAARGLRRCLARTGVWPRAAL